MLDFLLAAVMAFQVRTATAAPNPPKLPFVEMGACPGEGCQYGPWTALQDVTVYDTWEQGRRAVGKVAMGDKVVGMTGAAVVLRPGVIRIDRGIPDLKLKAGEMILTYTYRGEGTSAVWFHGKYDPDFDISFSAPGCAEGRCSATTIDNGRKEWWARIRLASGRTGWVNMDSAPFDGTCAICAQ